MWRYVLNRVLTSGLIVWGVLSLTFLMVHMAPGDPSSLYVRPEIGPKSVERIRHQMGLNRPLWKQYCKWMREYATGNFGISFSRKQPVRDILAEAIPNTLQLTVLVFLLQLALGVVLGVISAVRKNSRVDLSISSILLLFYSVPGFWLGQMAILVFALKLGWLPSSQMQSLQAVDGLWAQFADRVEHLILPVLVLTIPFAAYTARFIRGSLSDVLAQDYIRTAFAYGIRKQRILFKYALRNALLPLVTLAGLYLPFLLGGAVVTETVFAWPGMGRLTVDSIFAHDFPVILATTYVAAATVVVGNLLSDLLYAAVDPRIRLRRST